MKIYNQRLTPRVLVVLLLAAQILAACGAPVTPTPGLAAPASATVTLTAEMTATRSVTPTPEPTPTPSPTSPADSIPHFSHVLVMVLENKEYGQVLNNPVMPRLNALAARYSLLSNYYGVRHPSLPNYLALVGGDTFGVTSDCLDCFIAAEHIGDRLDAAGLTWKTYQEDIPSPCFIGSTDVYAQKHNPFIYFDNVRLDPARCGAHIQPLSALADDLQANTLPDFAFISPNMCHTSHDCSLDVTDQFVGDWVEKITASPAFDRNSLLVITFDEGTSDRGCCGDSLAGVDLETRSGGGHVFTVLVSSRARPGFTDDTPYNHYALLKTLLAAWNLPPLKETDEKHIPLITAPWLP